MTLPIELLGPCNLKKRDGVVFKETEEGLLISPKEALVMNLLDEIADGLEARGISLDELIESGRKIRQESHEEEYAAEADEQSIHGFQRADRCHPLLYWGGRES